MINPYNEIAKFNVSIEDIQKIMLTATLHNEIKSAWSCGVNNQAGHMTLSDARAIIKQFAPRDWTGFCRLLCRECKAAHEAGLNNMPYFISADECAALVTEYL